MEIIEKGRKGPKKFTVVRSLFWNGKIREKGQEIEVADRDSTALVQSGKIIPADIPSPTGLYIALHGFVLPGSKDRFEAKPMEVLELRDDQVLPLLLAGDIIPKDDRQWRPHDRRLADGKKPNQSQKKIDERVRAEFLGKAAGLPSQKGRWQ